MNLNQARILNPWWEDKEAIAKDGHITEVAGKSYYFDNPLKQTLAFESSHTYILRGSRQVGKTTLLKEKILQAIQNQYFEPKACFYLSCENLKNFKELENLLIHWLDEKKTQPTLLCLDEITFVEEWQRALLWLLNAGLLKKTTTMITGSNARDLKKSAERFPGRNVQEIKMYPLSLKDYQQLRCFQNKSPEELLEIYYQVGGFPHAIGDFCEKGFVTDTTYETYANWIFGDAHRFELNREILTHILLRIFDVTASQITWQRLIEKSAVHSHETAAAYVEHLEDAFLCFVLRCYDPDKQMSAPRKAKKIYFLDPLLYALVGGYLKGIRNTHSWWQNMLEKKEIKSQIFEAIVAGHFAREFSPLYFWYSANLKREVDLLVKKPESIELYEMKMTPQAIKPALGKSVKLLTPEIFLQTVQF